MQIQINRDFDEYKDDFFKGLTKRETFYALLTVIAGAGAYLICFFVLRLPVMVSVYLCLPFCLPIAAMGFLHFNNMTATEILKRRRRILRSKPLGYISGEMAHGYETASQLEKELKETAQLDKAVLRKKRKLPKGRRIRNRKKRRRDA